MTLWKQALVAVAGLSLAQAAAASCGGSTYCSSSSHSAYDLGETVVSGSSYSTSSTYSSVGAVDYTSGSYGSTSYRAPAVSSSGPRMYSSHDGGTPYGAPAMGSSGPRSYGISESYTLNTDVSHSGSISGLSVPGLGAGEQLCPTSCGTPAVGGHSAAGGKVLGCYAVCKPAPQPVTTTVLTQVVRPVYYVRYPVPYAVPVTVPGSLHYSRYGDHAHRGGYAPNCSYDYGYHGHGGGYGYGCR